MKDKDNDMKSMRKNEKGFRDRGSGLNVRFNIKTT